MYGTFTLTGRHTTPSGKAHAGQVVISPNTTIRDVDGDVVMSGAERVALDETGAWSIVLPCDSPGLNPSEGLGYRIGYALHSVSELPQSFYATADLAGSTLDVSDIVTVSVPAPLSAIVGPQGEPGKPGAIIGVVTGLIDDDTTDNRATIQAALDEGGTVVLPPTSGRYAIDGTLVMSVPGTRLLCHGAPVRQLTDTYGIVNVHAADCEVDGLDAIGSLTTPDFAGRTATWEGSIVASRWTAIGVYQNAHRLRIPFVRARNMSSAVRVAGWNDATDSLATSTVDDVEIGLIVVDGVEFGLAAKATRRLKLGAAKGTFGNILNAPRTPHLVYFADDTNLVHHWQVKVGDVLATNGTAQAAQFKGIVGGEVASIQATGCAGVLNVMDCSDVTFGSVLSTNDSSTDPSGSLTFDQTTTLERVVIQYAKIRMASDGNAVKLLNGTDCRIDALDVTTDHTTTGAATAYDVDVRGTRATLGLVNVENTGAKAWRAVGVFSGSGHRITAGSLLNIRFGIDTRSTDAVVYYDRDRITLHPVDGIAKITAISTGAAKWYARQTDALTNDQAVKVADNFTLSTSLVPSSTLTGQAWTPLSGSWRVDGETTRAYESAGVSNGAIVVDSAISNASVEVCFTSQNSEGIVVRATDASNYLTIRLHRSSGQVDIMKRVAGANTVLSSTAVATTLGRRYRMRVEVYGAEIKAYLDGVLIVTYSLTGGDEVTFASQTKHGLRSNVSTAARFDSFRILALN